MRLLMNFFFLSCQKSTELIEKKLNTKLSFQENLRLRIHLSMCNACTRFGKQSIFLDKSIEHLHKKKTTKSDHNHLTEKIIKSLDSK